MEQSGFRARPDRLVGRFGNLGDGPTLLVIAGVHGNEPSGYLALRSIFSEVEAKGLDFTGSVVGLVGNREALAEGVRFIDEDLNRLWRSGGAGASSGTRSAEAAEAAELRSELDALLERSGEGPVFALDLHSTSGPGPAFVVFDDSIVNREFALEFEVPLILGIEEELEGTLLDYLSGRGVRTVGFEAGQHEDPLSVTRAEAAIWTALRASGVIAESEAGDRRTTEASDLLALGARHLPRVVEVRHRHAIAPESGFAMRPGLAGFQSVARGEEVAIERGRPVRTPESGLLLMPLYQAQGEDGYFLVQPVRKVWLAVSARLRSWRLERVVHWLPGVRRAGKAGTGEIIVDRRVARWLPLDFFHLLGFRRMGEKGRLLRFRRRREALERVGAE